jgi:hypothetical protein
LANHMPADGDEQDAGFTGAPTPADGPASITVDTIPVMPVSELTDSKPTQVPYVGTLPVLDVIALKTEYDRHVSARPLYLAVFLTSAFRSRASGQSWMDCKR